MGPWSIYLRVVAGHQQTVGITMSAIAGVLVILALKRSGRGRKNILYVIQQHPDNSKH